LFQACSEAVDGFCSGEWQSDPRLAALGQRTVLPAQSKPTSPSGEPETEGIEYKAWRIEHGVAEGDTEMPSGNVPSELLQVITAMHSF